MTTPPFKDSSTSQGAAKDGLDKQVPLKYQLAMNFFSAALAKGPRLADEVMQEGIQQGHTQRTLERARSLLNVQSWPEGFQGPRWIALKDDPAAIAIQQRRKERQQPKGNGRKRRKRRKQQSGGGSDPQDALLAAAR